MNVQMVLIQQNNDTLGNQFKSANKTHVLNLAKIAANLHVVQHYNYMYFFPVVASN